MVDMFDMLPVADLRYYRREMGAPRTVHAQN